MKIVYVATSIVPSRTANSVHVMKMCAALGRAGHDVTLAIPMRRERLEGVSDVFAYYGVTTRFAIRLLPWMRPPGRGILYAWRAAKLVGTLSAELLYSRSVHACYFAARRGIPTIFESHAPVSDFDGLGTWMFRRLIAAPSFRHLVVISDALKDHYQFIYPELDGRVRVVPDAADEIALKAPAPVSDGRLTVGYVGHLYPGRGIDQIVALAERCSWADFRIVGGAPQDVEHWRARCRHLTNVIFHGFRPPAEVQNYIHDFHVVLAPYQRNVRVYGGHHETSRWMSPLKIFEYMAARKPMIVSDLPVLREVLNENNSVLVDPENLEAWVRALESLRNEERRERIAAQAYADFLASFTWDKRARRVMA